MSVRAALVWIVVLAIALPVLGSVASLLLLPETRFPHLPLHSTVEALGGLMALAIAGVLIAERGRGDDTDHYLWMAVALVAMGVLDIFHAAVPVGNRFVWLHSTATFVGGALFTLVWLGAPRADARQPAVGPLIVLIAVVAFGGLSATLPEVVPTMAVDGQFTLAARGLNILGGFGFLAAAAFFVRRYLRKPHPDEWIFAIHCGLFGAAGILFELSALWDAAWWWWHVLRLAAYTAALGFAWETFVGTERALHRANFKLSRLTENLDQKVLARTAELRQTQALYASLVENLPQHVMRKDLEGHYTFLNQNAARLFGLPVGELLGKTDFDTNPREMAEKYRRDDKWVIENDALFTCVEQQQLADGPTWVEVVKTPLHDEAGQVSGLQLIFWDVTEKKRTAEALRRSEARLRSLFDSRIIGVIFANVDGQLTDANDAFLNMLGYRRDDLPLDWRAITPPELQYLDEQAIEQLQAEGVATPWEKEYIARDGRRVPILIGVAMLEGDEGESVCFVLDITERKEMEEALARSNRDLEQFAYAASHDLQEPLRAVHSYCKLLSRRYQGKLDSDADEFIGFAIDGAARMQVLIDDLLKFSRVSTRGGERKPVELGEAVERALANLSTAVVESGARINVGTLPTVAADGGQLAQLLQNLLGNAIKYRSDDRSPEVDVSAVRAGDEWQISIRDNGIGVATESQARIFEVFQRLHTREEYSGTGIGLALCKKIVEQHGGRIWVESEAGAGSTFHFTLAAATEGAEVPRAVPAKA